MISLCRIYFFGYFESGSKRKARENLSELFSTNEFDGEESDNDEADFDLAKAVGANNVAEQQTSNKPVQRAASPAPRQQESQRETRQSFGRDQEVAKHDQKEEIQSSSKPLQNTTREWGRDQKVLNG